MSGEQTQNKICFNANISLHQQRKSAFIAKTIQHWYFTKNVQNVRRLQKHKHGDAGVPLLTDWLTDFNEHTCSSKSWIYE